jgi:hypothetical protein
LLYTTFLISVSFLAYLSAVYIASASAACLALTVTSYNPLPSAYNLMCKGIVYPLAFYQLDIQAGIFQSFISYAVNFLGGDLFITGKF